MKYMPYCIALALGEACGLSASGFSSVWPVAAALAVFVLLYGYGLSWRHWPLAFVFLAGVALAVASLGAHEARLRDRFWLRARDERRLCQRASTGSDGLRDRIRRNLSRRVALGLSDDQGTVSLSRAILLGERGHMPWKMRRLFVDAGTMHVFAISGLHIGVIAKTLAIVFMLFFVPLRPAGALGVAVLWFYVWIIGFPPSALRAAVMATLYFLAPVFYRRPDMLTAWALTFLGVHVIAPGRLFDVGSSLSFTVMLAILLFARHAPKWVALGAWGAGVPITAHFFGQFTPGGLLANLLVLPTALVSVVTGVLGVLTSFASEMLACHLNNISSLGVRFMTAVSYAVSTLPGAHAKLSPWPVWECALWYAAMLLSLYWAVLRRRQAARWW